MQNGHFPFIYCIETLVEERKYPQWETCFEKLKLNPKRISDCYNSGRGKKVSAYSELPLVLYYSLICIGITHATPFVKVNDMWNCSNFSICKL